MKNLKKIYLSIILVTFAQTIFAQGWSFSLDTQAAYYPKSDYIASSEIHFAPIIGAYSAIEAKTTLNANYKIPTPLGEHFLLKSAYVTFNPFLEVSPLTIKPGMDIYFSPLPFLVFSTGANFGTGWNISSLQGLAVLDQDSIQTDENDDVIRSSIKYNNLTPFKNWRYDFYLKALFQFDTGAIFKGDWTHVVMQASYKLMHTGVTGLTQNDIWLWQNSNTKTNGWNYQFDWVLAYQMPLVLKRVGFMGDIFGQYGSDSYGKFHEAYNGDFASVDISPFIQLEFNQNHSMAILFTFRSSRSFDEEHESSKEKIYLEQTGTEWAFYRIGLQWLWKI